MSKPDEFVFCRGNLCDLGLVTFNQEIPLLNYQKFLCLPDDSLGIYCKV